MLDGSFLGAFAHTFLFAGATFGIYYLQVFGLKKSSVTKVNRSKNYLHYLKNVKKKMMN